LKKKHQNYNPNNLLNDIAILKLSEEVTLNERIQIACLPQQKSQNYPSQTNIDSWVVGFGTTSSGGSLSNDLKNVKITLYPSTQCSQVYPSVMKNWNLQICAGEIVGGKDSCQGDSGGSLYIRETRGNKIKYVSVGIVSYGDECGLPNKPGIYTRVSYYLDWIVANSHSLTISLTTPIVNPSITLEENPNAITRTIASQFKPINASSAIHLELVLKFLVLMKLTLKILQLRF
jgi:secreted trypsin-like serine protease